jgi:chromosome segregation ATPase
MGTPILNILSLGATVVASGLAFYHWRRSSGLYSLLLEGANRYEELRQRMGQLEASLQKSDQKAAKDREIQQKIDKDLHEAHQKNAVLMQEVQAKDHELGLVREKFETQRGHLERHLLKVTEQLKTIEEETNHREGTLRSEVQALRERLQAERREFDHTVTALRVELSHKDKDLAGKVHELEKERTSLEKRLKQGDPLEIKRLRRKLAGYERLYSSMKGLRDMTDERNRNWEVALRKLSSFIVSSKHGAGYVVPDAIGPLVGEAMELIGAQLVDDSVDFSTVRDSTAAQKVEAEIAVLEAENLPHGRESPEGESAPKSMATKDEVTSIG